MSNLDLKPIVSSAIWDPNTSAVRIDMEHFDALLWVVYNNSLKSEAQKSAIQHLKPTQKQIQYIKDSGLDEPDYSLNSIAQKNINIINNASLEVCIEIETHLKKSTAYIWATPTRAVKVNTIDGINIDIVPMSTERIPQAVADFIIIDKSVRNINSPIPISAEILKQIQDSTDSEQQSELMKLSKLDETQTKVILAMQGPDVRKWTITSTWSSENGEDSAKISGIDLGKYGQWLEAYTSNQGTPEQYNFTLLTFGDVAKALRSLMPRSWKNDPLQNEPMTNKHLAIK